MKTLWNIISSIMILALTYAFVRWYIKGHFGKYFIFFWLNTIIAINIYIYDKATKPKHDPTPGYVYWERNVSIH
jgi:hypothetical protein